MLKKYRRLKQWLKQKNIFDRQSKKTIRKLTKNRNKNIQKMGIKIYKKWEYISTKSRNNVKIR